MQFLDQGVYRVTSKYFIELRTNVLKMIELSCCKQLGIEGIKYYSSGYNCYVTWEDDYFEFVDYEVVEPKG